MQGFIAFIREQGVVGLAVGFILGGAVSKLVASLANDIVNPLVGVLFTRVDELQEVVWQVRDTEVLIGNFLTVILDFVIAAAIVYFVVKGLKLDKIDKKKEAKK